MIDTYWGEQIGSDVNKMLNNYHVVTSSDLTLNLFNPNTGTNLVLSSSIMDNLRLIDNLGNYVSSGHAYLNVMNNNKGCEIFTPVYSEFTTSTGYGSFCELTSNHPLNTASFLFSRQGQSIPFNDYYTWASVQEDKSYTNDLSGYISSINPQPEETSGSLTAVVQSITMNDTIGAITACASGLLLLFVFIYGAKRVLEFYQRSEKTC